MTRCEAFGDTASLGEVTAVLARRAQYSANVAEAARDHASDPVLIDTYDQAARQLRRHARILTGEEPPP